MRLFHKTPCYECPWRRTALAGWLGGHPAEYYADAVAAGEVPACHRQDHGPESDTTAFCVGALTCMANQAMVPKCQHKGQELAAQSRDEVGKDSMVFTHHAEFYEHHTDRVWVPRYLRGNDG